MSRSLDLDANAHTRRMKMMLLVVPATASKMLLPNTHAVQNSHELRVMNQGSNACNGGRRRSQIVERQLSESLS